MEFGIELVTLPRWKAAVLIMINITQEFIAGRDKNYYIQGDINHILKNLLH